MEKVIEIAGKEVKMRVSARIPHEYRNLFGGDIIREMQKMEATGTMSDESVQMYEQLAWLMARNAGEEVYADLPTSEAVGAWLDGFDDMFAILEAAPAITELWVDGKQTTSVPRKK